MNWSTLISSRLLPFPISKVQKAWTNPEFLITWWGPNGFSNEFEVCDIIPDGNWIFTMIAPDGTRYANVSKWLEITEDYITLEHVNAPHFFLRVDFEDLSESTKITWAMTFDSPEILEALKPIIIPANEENFNRLEECLAKL
jgi:uncharacterized protein YndB with AHSA1/START domain